MYELQKWLVCAGFDALTVVGTSDYPPRQFEDDIVIYPEVVTGNPLRSKRVVRYILNEPGKLGGTKEYAKYELRVAYNGVFTSSANDLIMMVPPIEPFFYSDDTPKIHTAVFIGKEKDLGLHPKESVYITKEFPSTRRAVARFLRSVETLYTYDLISAIALEAMLCGCNVKIINKDGTIEDYPGLVTLLDLLGEFKSQLHDFIEMTQSIWPID